MRLNTYLIFMAYNVLQYTAEAGCIYPLLPLYLSVPGLSVERNLGGILSRSHSLLITIILTLLTTKYIYLLYMDVESRNPDADPTLAVVRYCIGVSLRSTSRCIHFPLVAVSTGIANASATQRNRKEMIR